MCNVINISCIVSFPDITAITCVLQKKSLLRMIQSGASLWRSGEESTCQCRGHGFEPWSRKIPHAMEQLSLHVTTTEARVPQLLKPVSHNY